MSAHTDSRRAMFLTNVAHYLTAFVVLLKGIDKVGVPGKELIGSIFILISLIICFGTIFHHKAEKHLKHFKAWVLILEAIVISIVGYLYMKEGKAAIQYVCFATAILFIIATFVYFKKVRMSSGRS